MKPPHLAPEPDDGRARAEAFARAALPLYGLDPEQTSLEFLTLSENGTFALEAPGQPRSVLRVHRPGYHSRAAIESELAWLSALADEQVVPVPPVLATAEGEQVGEVRLPDGEARHLVRFGWVEGAEPDPQDDSALQAAFTQLGTIAARMHLQVQAWEPPPGFTRLRWDVTTALGPHGHWGDWRAGLGVGPSERALLERATHLIGERLQAYGDRPERFGLVHADMRLANLLVQGPQITVIDFDDCGHSWFGYDFAAAVSFFEHDPRVPDLAQAWVQGYRSQRPFGDDDVAELATLVMLRRLLLVAWIGSHSATELALSMGEQFTADSCGLAEQFLSSHG